MIVKKFLFIMQSPPHHGVSLQETLDVILTTAAFEQHLALLFLDEGVFQLKKTQRPALKGLKDTLCIFDALEMYDVNEIYIEAESMNERGLKKSDLSLPAQLIARSGVNALMKQFEIIVSG